MPAATHTPLVEMIGLAVYQRFGVDLSQARDLEVGSAASLAMLEQCFHPRASQVVWCNGPVVRVLARSANVLEWHPDADEMAELQQGELLIQRDADTVQMCVAPLRAAADLVGWLVLESPLWNADSSVALSMIAGQAGPALMMLEMRSRQQERDGLSQRNERQALQLSTLNRIGRTITSSLDPERIPSLIMEQATGLMNAEEGSLLLVDEESSDLVFAYTTGPIGQQLLGKRLPHGVGLAGYVVETGQSVIANDVRQDDRFDTRTDRTTGYVTRSLLATPVRGVGGIEGVIEVLNRRDGTPFTAEDQRLLEALADYATIALANARRFAQVDRALARRAQELTRSNDQLQHNLRSLTALNALSLAINSSLREVNEIFSMTAHGVVEMTNALGASVVLPEGDRFNTVVQVGSPLPLEQYMSSAIHHVINSGRIEIVDANLPKPLVQAGIAGMLLVPLRATQRTLGCMCVWYADALPDPSDRETIVLFAAQAAGAVQSIELFTAVRRARDQMASILASTREGIMLIEPDARVAIANGALYQLCDLPPHALNDVTVEQFLEEWGQGAGYIPEEWIAMHRAIMNVCAARETFVSGELNGSNTLRSLEWMALVALSSGDSRGGALLVLRDITEAKESERLREDLTHMIVHDLRSPLSSVMASVELLTKGVAGQLNSRQQDVLTIASASSHQMLDMINTLLDINRLESGRMPLELAQYTISPLIMRAAGSLEALAAERNIMLECTIPDDLPEVCADDNLIVRVLQNLIVNALKFSGRNSSVRIRASADAHPPQEAEKSGLLQIRHERFVAVSVTDQGIGIAPKDREKIFTKFGQVGERRGGTGLGLTFCKLVIEAHEGQIWVESVPGQGSTFSFKLPLE